MTIDPGAGARLIMRERVKQRDKWTAQHDDNLTDSQLANAAAELAVSSVGNGLWPKGWAEDYRQKIESEPEIRRLVVAGAFIAAELDRLLRSVTVKVEAGQYYLRADGVIVGPARFTAYGGFNWNMGGMFYDHDGTCQSNLSYTLIGLADYKDRQRRWIDEFKLTLGSDAVVKRLPIPGEQRYEECKCAGEMVGVAGSIGAFYDDGIQIRTPRAAWVFPYYVIELK